MRFRSCRPLKSGCFSLTVSGFTSFFTKRYRRKVNALALLAYLGPPERIDRDEGSDAGDGTGVLLPSTVLRGRAHDRWAYGDLFTSIFTRFCSPICDERTVRPSWLKKLETVADQPVAEVFNQQRSLSPSVHPNWPQLLGLHFRHVPE